MNTGIRVVVLVVLLVTTGCASTPDPSTNEILVSRFSEGDLVAEETERGVVVYLPSVIFEFGSTELNPLGTEKIKFVAEVSNEEFINDRILAVEGHTDSMGGESFNLDLSKARSTNVSETLHNQGIPMERLQVVGFGESRPLVPNTFSDGSDNPEGRATNRRVEIIILNP